MNIGQIQEQLILEEGIGLRIYRDSLGNLTGGVGHRTYDDYEEGEYITLEHAGYWLEEDIKRAISDLRKYIPFFNELASERQYVLISMTFNMGIGGVMKFKKMLLALENRDYELAALEMKNSVWHRQVKSRALKLENIMRTGVIV